MKSTVGIIGAGPAGLTAAHELTSDPRFLPIIFESDVQVGGIAKTINYNGNRMDLGGHRFFTKVARVNAFWDAILPVTQDESAEKIMLCRSRLSRILFGGKYYDYPVSPNFATLKKLGPCRLSKIGITYLQAVLSPIKPEKNLEDFFINRFGRELYEIFFEQYTEKVWGVPCREIPKDWGAQRIKGLSVYRALLHAAAKLIHQTRTQTDETSLIEAFYYPKYGPGQFWEETAAQITRRGGELNLQSNIVGFCTNGEKLITALQIKKADGSISVRPVDYVISSMPIKELVAILPDVPEQVQNIACNLPYRDFVTIGLLIKKNAHASALKDNWIYIQEPHLRAGRIQLFNNWSPYLVSDPTNLWVGLEYFCQENDSFWNSTDNTLLKIAEQELRQIGYIQNDADIIDATVIRVRKAYPAYFGSYADFPILQEYLAQYPNLYLVGRNGMHRYNNMDHSMLTAMYAADLIKGTATDKSFLWTINTEEDYHETKSI